MVAVGFATIPLWTALINGIVHKWPTRLEWLALLVGLAGIVLLTQEGEFRSAPAGVIAVIIGAIAFSLGSVTSSRITQPVGLMGTAVGMLSAGIFLITVSQALGEHMDTFPKLQPLLSLAYLIFLPSILAFAAYGYLLKTVGPLRANSFAYTNPVVALLLGALLGGETISMHGVLAMAVIIGGLVLLNVSRGRKPVA
jgi:drug/metabolite transporter (DMT)-like permease